MDRAKMAHKQREQNRLRQLERITEDFKMNIKVENMVSPRGNIIPNQFDISVNGQRYFQSYSTVIVRIDRQGEVFLDEDAWDYSRTTGKYRNQFLGETLADTRAKIKTGEYQLTNLN